jgi:hypothetical protein
LLSSSDTSLLSEHLLSESPLPSMSMMPPLSA